MSSYYAAYFGSALVLREKEYSQMIKNYEAKVVTRLRKTLQEDFFNMREDEGCLIREYSFIRSNNMGEDPNDVLESESSKTFGIIDISPDDCDGMYLLPYLNNGKLHWEHDTGIDLRSEKLYAIFSDFQLDSPLAFIAKPYESYDNFVDEFKEKLKEYLPDDFDWDSHIGCFSYSCYA